MPLAPILMYPAYRYGKMTPWGGNLLRTLYQKDIPDDQTGESLEISAIPGLESRDEFGNTLPQLIEKYGRALVGTAVMGPFPLLLKLLNARDTLSVQVHPDDDYAGKTEHKLGKTEAWHILYAEPGAELVFGVEKGVTREMLRMASQEGEAVEKLLRRIPVKAGETYFIPAGMVHAIGAGILLYEIQQSSDVTYRFYDWERRDESGCKRQLHIQKAVDVADVDHQPAAVVEKKLEQGRYLLFNEKYFSTEKLIGYTGRIMADCRRFSILTAVEECRLSWQTGQMILAPGRTALLPADGYDLVFDAPYALISYPTCI